MTTSEKPVEILFVEDSPDDVQLTLAAFTTFKLGNRIHVVNDGEAALAFLRHQPPYEQAPRPDLVILDLNLPRKDGREVLAEIKSDTALSTIPVVVLTVSTAETDLALLSQHRADGYLTKPLDFQQIASLINFLPGFSFLIVKHREE